MPRWSRWILYTVAMLLVVLIAVNYNKLPWSHDDSTTVAVSGGTARNSDGSLSAKFAPGQLSAETQVSFSRDVPAPPPVPGFQPLARPFDVSLNHPSRGGTVTTTYQLPPDSNVKASRLVMFIEDEGSWKLVPTSVNTKAHTVTGTWPHFSKGYLGWFNPLFQPIDGGKKAAEWSWDKVVAGANWTADNTKKAASAVVSGAVSAAGGTTKSVKCDPDGHYWQFTKSTGTTGCSGPKDSTGMWPVQLNDRYPYALLVKLPQGAVGPGWKDLQESAGLADLVLAMIASRSDQLIIPPGATVPLKFAGNAPPQIHLKAQVDPYTTSVRVVVLAALVLTGGMSAEALAAAKAEIVALESEVYSGFIAARTAGSTSLTMAEYITQTQAQNSLIQMRKRALRKVKIGLGINALFDKIDLADCVIGAAESIKEAGQSFSDQVDGGIKLLSEKCLPAFLQKSIEVTYERQFSLLDPAEQLARSAELVEGLAESFQDIIGLATIGVTGVINTLTLNKVNLGKAGVTATQPVANVVTAVRDEILARFTKYGDNIIAGYGDDWIRFRGPGQEDKAPIECGGIILAKVGETAYCDNPTTLMEGTQAIVRVVKGTPPTAEVVLVTGDHGEACTIPWALKALHEHGDYPPCD